MCDPLTMASLAMTAIGAVGSLFGGGGDTGATTINNMQEATAPPAIAAPTSRKAGADVRIGREAKAKSGETAPSEATFKEKRKSAVALGGLGRSGLIL